jgi:hypothetical protein
MYTAGTKSMHDFEQWYLIPTGNIQDSSIYQRAEQILIMNPQVTRIVGHSMGSVAAERLAQHYNLDYQLYGTPQISMPGLSGSSHSVSNIMDPVSMLDFNSFHQLPPSFFRPHEY